MLIVSNVKLLRRYVVVVSFFCCNEGLDVDINVVVVIELGVC